MDQKDALQIRPAWAEDWPALRQLLQTCGLIETGVAAQLDRVRVATWRGRIVGMALLERYAEGGLLRSVAVEPAWQGRGIGRRLVDVMLEEARREGLSQVFLLTETAADFFARLGFVPVTREEVPASVRAAPQFTYLCPISSQVMCHILR
ncbi:arsenic resistance N-acetyltransferase ArsN2 [Rhodothermus marinus]|uniref:GCN5-related N-acetyltransferase n=1 Tax=Rhodothermus marinus (strain ATCC 43812 / DSM 4252 / R-10) TaxID=518766 RepID=D0MFW2_RHOM4|nr:arsenic resistance N-acetyltransferase ArsN2 [Rhodothermus marinus]ACY49451.1 GCN5-related N-acetyltransferase [Rhodothermus marinus DSM 4252]